MDEKQTIKNGTKNLPSGSKNDLWIKAKRKASRSSIGIMLTLNCIIVPSLAIVLHCLGFDSSVSISSFLAGLITAISLRTMIIYFYAKILFKYNLKDILFE